MKHRSIVRVGTGYDLHRLETGRSLIMAGINIPYEKGLAGHSDADVVIHAVIDALLGAAGLDDIGQLFPDTDPKYKNIDSAVLLAEALRQVHQAGYTPVNIDVTIIAQQPKLAPHKRPMRENLARTLGCDLSQVNVKAKTEEGLGFTGKKQGIAAYAVCIVHKKV